MSRASISRSRNGAGNVGVNHLGLQANRPRACGAAHRFDAADSSSIVDEPNVHCCYAKADKHWVTDPQGIAWEAFHTLESIRF